MSSRYQGPIIDAHHHLWDISLGRHPWLTSDDSAIKALGDISYLRQNYLVEDLVEDIGPQKVVGSVYVEAAWDRARPPVEEVAWLEGLSKTWHASRRAASPGRRSNRPDVAASLDALAGHSCVVGIREVVRWHPDPAKRWTQEGILDDPSWRQGFDALRAHGFLLELLMNPFQARMSLALRANSPIRPS